MCGIPEHEHIEHKLNALKYMEFHYRVLHGAQKRVDCFLDRGTVSPRGAHAVVKTPRSARGATKHADPFAHRRMVNHVYQRYMGMEDLMSSNADYEAHERLMSRTKGYIDCWRYFFLKFNKFCLTIPNHFRLKRRSNSVFDVS